MLDQSSNYFSGDTKIALLSGKDITFKELEQKREKVWVYTYNHVTGHIEPSLAEIKKSKINNNLSKITLDNLESIICSNNHLWMLRDGTYKKAEELNKGVSLMPLYRKKDKYGYERFLSPVNNKWITTHWNVAHKLNLKVKDNIHTNKCNGCKIVLHHNDFKADNNNPDNLIPMWECKHRELHAMFSKDPKRIAKLKESWVLNYDERIEISIKNIEKYNESYKNGEVILTSKQINARKSNGELLGNLPKLPKTEKQLEASKRNGEYAGSLPKTLKQIETARLWGSIKGKQNSHNRWHGKDIPIKKCLKCNPIINHKVINIEVFREEIEVYSLTVFNNYNFALSSGIFVHC